MYFIPHLFSQNTEDASSEKLFSPHDSRPLEFVNKHPHQIENLCRSFLQGAIHPLEAGPEGTRRAPRQARGGAFAEPHDGQIISVRNSDFLDKGWRVFIRYRRPRESSDHGFSSQFRAYSIGIVKHGTGGQKTNR